ncbi:MAG TPA: hypothetical protein PLG97_07680 [Alcaligenes sp.]|nr:hypothetical protein [Alcaligenes sp.]HRL27383.1 hypothetical protein [Alcaligenes sp.]
MKTWGRSIVVLGFTTVLAACSSGGSGAGSDSAAVSGAGSDSAAVSGTPRLFNQCTWNRSSCMHEGRYEAGEREYAEQEARDLNRASAARLRKGR